ncbi:MAG: hypothetical protein P8100_08915 [bacterium]
MTGTVVSTQLIGNADDGDSTTPPDRYGPTGNDRNAEDSKTKSSSSNPTFNKLGGHAEAETLNPGPNTITSDEARAASFNKVVSALKVKIAGKLKFQIDLDVRHPEIHGTAKLNITLKAGLLKNDGTDVPQGGIINKSFRVELNQSGSTIIVIDGDANQAEQPDSNGNYQKVMTVPVGGVQLQAGDYRLEFDLRVIATASTAENTETQANRASVDSVSAKISLR